MEHDQTYIIVGLEPYCICHRSSISNGGFLEDLQGCNCLIQLYKKEGVMGNIRRLVLDTLKPHEPGIIEMSKAISELEGVFAVNISIYEIDRKVENAKITIEGDDISYPSVLDIITDMGATVHSIDEVVAGRKIIEDATTPQD
jgi:hypothetical protein